MKKEIYFPNRIYLSGKISGLPTHVYEHNFRMAKWMITNQHGAKNVQVINPLELKPFFGIKTWICHMITDVFTIFFCHSIYMLRGWEMSRGAKIEHGIAKIIGLKIYYQK